MKNNQHLLLLALGVCTSTILSAQPLFQISDSLICVNQPVSITPLISNTFATYHWDMGNGVTADTYNPPVFAYTSPGTYTVKLTIAEATPFAVVDAFTIIQTSNYWISTGLFCGNDGNPDFYLRLLSNDGDVLFVTPENYEVAVPSSFQITGILNQHAFRVAVLDRDYSIWCQPDDYMGEVSIPAGATGGTYENTASALAVSLQTHPVTSTTFSYSITAMGANKPTVSCTGDSLISSYATGNQWFNSAGVPQSNGSFQAFKPGLPGVYYVQYSGHPCGAIQSVWVKYPSCEIVATHDQTLLNDQIRLLPNPSAGPFEVMLPEVFSGEAAFSICNMLGEQIMTRRELVQAGKAVSFDLSAFPAGIYLLRVDQAGLRAQKQILIQR